MKLKVFLLLTLIFHQLLLGGLQRFELSQDIAQEVNKSTVVFHSNIFYVLESNLNSNFFKIVKNSFEQTVFSRELDTFSYALLPTYADNFYLFSSNLTHNAFNSIHSGASPPFLYS